MVETPLNPTAIRAGVRIGALPRLIRCYGQVGSTMDLARELLSQATDADLPLLVTAEEQTAGRGRKGRRWEAPPGSALLLSLAMRPGWLPPDRAVALVWLAATALCEAVERTTSLGLGLKWPNDLLIAQAPGAYAKAAGILLETSYGKAGIEAAIIGCGVNISAAPPAGSTRYPATSLAAAGAEVGRLELLLALLGRMDHWHQRLLSGDDGALHAAWRGRLLTLGQHVVVDTPAGRLHGLAEDVDRNGALLLRDASGVQHSISAGDVGLI